MVYQLFVRPTSKRCFLNIVQVTMKHNPFDAMQEFIQTLHPSMNFYSCGSSHMINQNKSTVVSIWSAMVYQLSIRPTSKRCFLKIIQVTMKHDPLDAMQESI
jgi:hypothetical protein